MRPIWRQWRRRSTERRPTKVRPKQARSSAPAIASRKARAAVAPATRLSRSMSPSLFRCFNRSVDGAGLALEPRACRSWFSDIAATLSAAQFPRKQRVGQRLLRAFALVVPEVDRVAPKGVNAILLAPSPGSAAAQILRSEARGSHLRGHAVRSVFAAGGDSPRSAASFSRFQSGQSERGDCKRAKRMK